MAAFKIVRMIKPRWRLQFPFYFYIIWSLIIQSVSLSAQGITGNFTQLTEKDGLASNTINSILVDDLGYIWIGTYNGLVRYDGYEFKRFYSNPNDPSAIQGMVAGSLFQDSRKNIWLGTNPAFIVRYDPVARAFHTFDYDSFLTPQLGQAPINGYYMNDVCEDDQGRMYFAISGPGQLENGLLYMDAAEDQVHLFSNSGTRPLQDVFSIHKDEKGTIWLVTNSGFFQIDRSGKLTEVDLSTLNFPRPESGEYYVQSIFQSKNHTWFLISDLSIYDYDWNANTYRMWKSPFQTITETERRIARNFILDEEGHLWIGTNAGIQFFDPANGQFEFIENASNPASNTIDVRSLALDDFDNLWIGTTNNGIFRFEQKPRFRSYLNASASASSNAAVNKPFISEGWVSNLTETPDGLIVMNCASGLSLLDPKTDRIENYNYGRLIGNQYYFTCLWLHQDTLFLGGSVSFGFSLKSSQFKQVGFPGIPGNLTLTSHITDRQGTEWISTRSGIYRRGKDQNAFEQCIMKDSLGTDLSRLDAAEIFEGNDHLRWILSDLGIYKYNPVNERIERIGYDKRKGDVFVSQDINSFYEDRHGMAWIGGWQGGLARYNPKTGEIKSYTIDDGLPSMSVQSIIGDKKNESIWLSTFNGICRFDPQSEAFYSFSLEDGIQGSLFADGSYLKTSDGLFAFGGSNGITVFDPEDFNINYEPPKVYLTDLKLFNKSVIPGNKSVLHKPIYETEQIVLLHNENDISLQFVALHYSNPIKNKYAYRLQPFDEDWRMTASQREAFYPNLPPGEYLFQVKAASDKGVWNQEAVLLRIIVLPPWWATWWAYLIYALLVLILIYSIIRWRTKSLEKEKIILEKNVAERTAALNESLQNLRAAQSQLIHSEKMASLGELTAGIAHEIQNPLNFVNNFSEVNHELLQELKDAYERNDQDLIRELTKDLMENEEKVMHHGRRAESIVKSMLLHSRTSTGEKESVDINTLIDEYLRLAFHGMRAKDKSFNAELKTAFADHLPPIQAVPQDLGRVVLNILNNALQAVADVKDPTISISTKSTDGSVIIEISDNGPGIPDAIRDKIFQPFFTTKPAGQGTGLGLSLSYDIVKAMGGNLSLEASDQGGAAFRIRIPV